MSSHVRKEKFILIEQRKDTQLRNKRKVALDTHTHSVYEREGVGWGVEGRVT